MVLPLEGVSRGAVILRFYRWRGCLCLPGGGPWRWCPGGCGGGAGVVRWAGARRASMKAEGGALAPPSCPPVSSGKTIELLILTCNL